MSIIEGKRSGWVNDISRFYSVAATDVCIAGGWAGWTEQKQEMLFSQPDLESSSVTMSYNCDLLVP